MDVERRERLGSVLNALYVIFTEGSTATSGDHLVRLHLAHEPVRRARVLAAWSQTSPARTAPPTRPKKFGERRCGISATVTR